MPNTFSFEDAQIKGNTFSWDEAMGKPPIVKQPMPDIAAADKAADNTSLTGFLSDTESQKDLLGNVAGAIPGAAEFVTSSLGSLAQMDFKTFATLGIISKDKANKINESIGKAIDPETEVGKTLTKWGGELFSFAPDKAKEFAKKLGVSEENSTHIQHLVEAGQLALGLKRLGASNESPSPKVEPTMGTEAKTGPVVPPGPAGPAIEIQPKPPIEGTATRVEDTLPAPTKALPAPSEFEGPGRTDYGQFPEGFIRRRQQQLGEEAAKKAYKDLPVTFNMVPMRAIETPKSQLVNVELAKSDKQSIANSFDNSALEEITMENPYSKGELPQTYETTPDKLGQVSPGSSISFGNIESGGSGVSLTRNTVPGEGAYRLTEWQQGNPIKHADYPNYETAIKDFQTHASRPDANGIKPDRLQVTHNAIDETTAKVASSFPPNQRGMIDPEVFKEGFGIMIGKLDDTIKAARDSRLMKGIYKTTEPLEAVTPATAAIIKDHANAQRNSDFQTSLTHKQLDQIPKEIREQMGLSVETPAAGRELTPVQEKIKTDIVNKNTALSEVAMRLGILKNVKQPYFPHLVQEYVKQPDWMKGFKRSGYIKTSLGSAKQRTYTGTVEEAEEASGLTRIHDIKALVDINHDLEKAIIGRNLINSVRDVINNEEARAMGFPGEKIPGGVPLEIPGATETKYFTRRWVEYNGQKIPVKDGSVIINNERHMVNMEEGKVVIGKDVLKVQNRPDHNTNQIYTTPDVKNAIEAAFKADNPPALIRALLGLKSISLRAIMVFPTFHHMTIMSKVIPAMPKAGFGSDIWWSPDKLYGKELFDSIPIAQRQTLRTWAGPYVAGEYIRRTPGALEEAMKDNLIIPQDKGYMMDLYGAENVPVQTWKQRVLNNLWSGLGDKLEKGNRFLEYDVLWRQVGNVGLATHKMLKVQGIEANTKDFVRQNGRQPLPEEAKSIADASGKQAGYVASLLTSMLSKEEFGKGYRAFLNLTLFSRSNLFSAARLLKYGLGVMPKWLQEQTSILDTTLGKGTAFRAGVGGAAFIILKDMALLYALWSFGNYMTTKYEDIPDKNGHIGGHFSWNNEPGKEEYVAIGKRDNGTVIYMNMPFRATRDTFNMITNPRVILKDKPSTIVKLIEGITTGKNWKDQDIAIPGHSLPQHMAEYTAFGAKTLLGYENTLGTLSPDNRHSYWRWRALGFQFAEGYPGGPAAGSLAEISKQITAQKQVYMDEAKDLSRAGKTDEGIKLLLQHNLYSELPNYILNSKDPKASILIHTHWEEIYRLATPEQREKLKEIKFGDK